MKGDRFIKDIRGAFNQARVTLLRGYRKWVKTKIRVVMRDAQYFKNRTNH